jgi:hypothetical protein
MALLAGSQATASVHARPATHWVDYSLGVTGQLDVDGHTSGQQANGGDCHLSADDASSPYESHYRMHLAWDTRYRFRYTVNKPPHGLLIFAKRTRVRATSYSYGGYFYNENCRKVSWKAGGNDCTGTMRPESRGTLSASARTDKTGYDLRLALVPFGNLVAQPASCLNDDDPQAAVSAEDQLQLGDLTNIVVGKVYTSHERLSAAVRRTSHIDLDGHTNCANGQDPAVCDVTWTGVRSLILSPLRHG